MTTETHDPRCLTLTDSEFNAICDCATLRVLDEGSEPHDLSNEADRHG